MGILAEQAPEQVKARVELLKDFRKALGEWQGRFTPEQHIQRDLLGHDPAPSKKALQARSFINRNVIAVKRAVGDVGVSSTVSVPHGDGRSIDPFSNVFRDVDFLIPMLDDMVEQAIGAYEHMSAGTGLGPLASPDAFDLEAAIQRALRVGFKEPPDNEKAVQDRIEVILASLGLTFTREQDTAPVGPRAFKPDFVLGDLDLALEVKLTNERHSASKTQEEMAADISAFRTRWKRLLIVVYDCGQIADPHRLREDNMKHFGVAVLVVKH